MVLLNLFFLLLNTSLFTLYKVDYWGIHNAEKLFLVQNYPPFDTPCEVNPDRWVLREPNEKEVYEHGQYVLVFEYYNSLDGCSNSMEDVPLSFNGKTIALLSVKVTNEEFDHKERVTLKVLVESGYTLFGDPSMLIPDRNEAHTKILQPIGY